MKCDVNLKKTQEEMSKFREFKENTKKTQKK